MAEETRQNTSRGPQGGRGGPGGNRPRGNGPRGDRPAGDRPAGAGRGGRDGRRGGRGGFSEVEKEFKEELLRVDRVTRVTAGGRQLRFRASIVIGDNKGTVGLGIGKGNEVSIAVEKATRDAKKHLITFPIKEGTIPYDISANFKASAVYLHPAREGTGIIAGGSIRKILSISGIRDIIAKQHGGKNPITNARVILKALAALQSNPKVRVEARRRRREVIEGSEADETPTPEMAQTVEAPASTEE